MKRTITDLTLTILAIMSLTCLISMMVLFLGGGQEGTDLLMLMYLQAGITPIALGIAVVGIYRFVAGHSWAEGARAMWRAIPQWQVFIFLLLNSLVFFGELAFVMVMRATEVVVPWNAHIPLVCIFVCSSAYLVLYASANSYPGSPPAMSGRWM
ncbi:MAG TPA: hypothetical protein PKK10_05215 [Woeseiaceae bacterium]|nr:hypothetical protein [Woeseiaceae bacterium]